MGSCSIRFSTRTASCESRRRGDENGEICSQPFSSICETGSTPHAPEKVSKLILGLIMDVLESASSSFLLHLTSNAITPPWAPLCSLIFRRMTALSLAFDILLNSVMVEKESEKLLLRAQRRMQHHKLYGAYSSWLANAVARKRKRVLLTRYSNRIGRRKLSSCFDAMKQRYNALRKGVRLLHSITTRRRLQILQGALNRMRLNTERKHVAEAHAFVLGRRICKVYLARSLKKWRARIRTRAQFVRS